MSLPRTFVVVDSPEHGEVVDALIAERLREVDGTVCNGWSGIYTDGQRFGVLWGTPVSQLFGAPPSEDHPDGDPSLVLVIEASHGDWEPVQPPEPEADL